MVNSRGIIIIINSGDKLDWHKHTLDRHEQRQGGVYCHIFAIISISHSHHHQP